ncbi:MAG: hypothetical protein Q4G30_01785 [Actinomycetaceae bacterium]|nr:hypothetical protein [Actinomycetaceae bacterium]
MSKKTEKINVNSTDEPTVVFDPRAKDVGADEAKPRVDETPADTNWPQDTEELAASIMNPPSEYGPEPVGGVGGVHVATGDTAIAPTGPTLGTLTWGIVMILVGVITIAVGLGVKVNFWAAMVAILGIAGLALLVTAVLTLRKAKTA